MHRSRKFHEEYEEYYPVDFQYHDWLKMDDPLIKDLCLVRACGGSKSFDGVNWAVLRATLHPYEHGAWLASKGGQLTQARQYFNDNPFVRKISGGKGDEIIHLLSGAKILFRSTTKAITGVRLDWLFLDEEEMLEPAQVEIVYPQLHGRLSKSKVGKFFHLGTMQYGTLFMENIKQYASEIHDWTMCPWLVEAGQIQGYIDAGIMPIFEIDMLYRCIPSVPGGAFFENIKLIPPYKYDPNLVDYGMDHGSVDHCVGVIIDGKKCTVVEEYSKDLERDNTAFDFLDGANIETEGGGYNDDVRYSAKAAMMARRIGAKKTISTQKWKQNRKMYARGFDVIEVIESACPETTKDLQGCRFGPDGLWLKDRQNPCHKVDSFMRAIGSGLHPRVFQGEQEHKEPDRVRQLLKLRKAGRKYNAW